MLLKVIGSVLVMGGSSAIGYALSGSYSNRPKQLKTLQSLLQILENEIRYMSSVIVDCFEKIYKSTNSPVSLFFKTTLEYLNNADGTEMNLAQAWEKSIRKHLRDTALNKEDADILISFGKMLGNSDLQGQIKNITFTLYQLDLQEQKAEELKKKYDTMYKTLGVLGGAVAVVLLI